MSKANLLNVKKHLEHIQLIVDSINKDKLLNNVSPIIASELKTISLINKAILKKHNTKNTRKDVYVNK